MNFSNIASHSVDTFKAAGDALFEVVSIGSSAVCSVASSTASAASKAASTTKNVTCKVAGPFFQGLDKVKSNPGQFGKLLLLGSYAIEFLDVSRLKPAAEVFGTAAVLFDVAALGGTIHYVVSKIWLKVKDGTPFFNNDHKPSQSATELSFGFINLGEAVLWSDGKRILNYSKDAALLIGGMTVFALVGFVVQAAGTMDEIYELGQAANVDQKKLKSKALSLAASVAEIALIAIPLAGCAPVGSLILAGKVFAKTTAIASFLYE